MVQDPVYNTFISPFYRAERLRADQAEARAEQEWLLAEQERQRAEQERQRAEHYATLLKAAGLLPPQA